jgi:hypothetical protein
MPVFRQGEKQEKPLSPGWEIEFHARLRPMIADFMPDLIEKSL